MKGITSLALLMTATSSLAGQSATTNPATSAPMVNLRAFADSVAPQGSAFDRTQRLVHWINDNFTWSATDYQKRTPQEIVARRSGNCFELASVLNMLLDTMQIRSRWVREINVQPEKTPRRQATAESMVRAKGNSSSVFGLQHNDHTWLEVWDDGAREWFPADPAYGVVGLAEWLPARLALDSRPKPRVPAVVPIAADMLAPFVVVAGDAKRGPFPDDRTEFYLIAGLDRLYGGRLKALPAWSRWIAEVHKLAPHARAAFEGAENLHSYTADIAELKGTYDELGREATASGITLRP